MRFSRILLPACLGLICTGIAHAQQIPVVCSGLAGCGAGPENTIFTRILPGAVSFMIKLAAGGAVIFIVFSGIRMLLSNGDEGAVSTAKKNIAYTLGGLGLGITSATIVGFVTSENYGQANPTDFFFGPAGLLASVMRITMTLFNAGFVIMILLGGIRIVNGGGSPEEFKKGGEIVKWAIVGAIVVNLARVLIEAFLNLDL